ncbi:hypothetical protein D3C79_1052150 [compost metagenome]
MKWLESPFELVNSLVYTLVDSLVNKFPQVLVADSLHQTTFVKRFLGNPRQPVPYDLC